MSNSLSASKSVAAQCPTSAGRSVADMHSDAYIATITGRGSAQASVAESARAPACKGSSAMTGFKSATMESHAIVRHPCPKCGTEMLLACICALPNNDKTSGISSARNAST
jgi:predicted RNA-binding Zn-ribbon protein involved in translation (DUF1610 family)